MIFSNLTFPDTKRSGVNFVFGFIASSVSSVKDHSSLPETRVRRYRKKLRSTSTEGSSNNRLTLLPLIHHKGRESLRHALFGLQITIITNIRSWQKQIYKHLVKIPLKEKVRIYYYEFWL